MKVPAMAFNENVENELAHLDPGFYPVSTDG